MHYTQVADAADLPSRPTDVQLKPPRPSCRLAVLRWPQRRCLCRLPPLPAKIAMVGKYRPPRIVVPRL